MKAYPVPSISKIEEVLDLLTDPQKYVKYMQDLQALHKTITDDLGLVRTKEKADKILADAYEAFEAAKKEYNEKSAEAAKLKADAQAEYDRATTYAKQNEDTLSNTKQSLDAVEHNLKTERRMLESRERDFEVQKKQLIDEYNKLEAELQAKAEELNKKQTKLDAAFAALG